MQQTEADLRWALRLWQSRLCPVTTSAWQRGMLWCKCRRPCSTPPALTASHSCWTPSTTPALAPLPSSPGTLPYSAGCKQPHACMCSDIDASTILVLLISLPSLRACDHVASSVIWCESQSLYHVCVCPHEQFASCSVSTSSLTYAAVAVVSGMQRARIWMWRALPCTASASSPMCLWSRGGGPTSVWSRKPCSSCCRSVACLPPPAAVPGSHADSSASATAVHLRPQDYLLP